MAAELSRVLSLLLVAQSTLGTDVSVYSLGVYNISSQRGFTQLLFCTCDKTEVSVAIMLQQSTFNRFVRLNPSNPYNVTFDNGNVTLTGSKELDGHVELPHGIKILAAGEIAVHGVVTGSGSADGFLVPQATWNSTEFYVAGWGNGPDCGLSISNVFNDTLVEIYNITRGTNYQHLFTINLPSELMTSQVAFRSGVDTTGLYVNSTKPISVFSQATCASVPSMSVGYCDYMTEHIPPVSELGTLHLVPPIAGRLSRAGYIVRIVATEPDTTISWNCSGRITDASSTLSAPPFVFGPRTIARSEFIGLNVANASLALKVECSKPCIVMQYNKGFRAAGSTAIETAQTDPFMMLTVPVDHFVTASCFSTANLALPLYNSSTLPRTEVGYTISDFGNFVGIVTQSPSLILLDGLPVSTNCNWSTFAEFSYTSVNITSGWHSVTGLNGATFAAYVYGHGKPGNPRSAYAYPAAYKLNGFPVTEVMPAETTTSDSFSSVTISAVERTTSWLDSAVSKAPRLSGDETETHCRICCLGAKKRKGKRRCIHRRRCCDPPRRGGRRCKCTRRCCS